MASELRIEPRDSSDLIAPCDASSSPGFFESNENTDPRGDCGCRGVAGPLPPSCSEMAPQPTPSLRMLGVEPPPALQLPLPLVLFFNFRCDVPFLFWLVSCKSSPLRDAMYDWAQAEPLDLSLHLTLDSRFFP